METPARPAVRRARAALAALAALLVPALAASCVSWTTGARSPSYPKDLGVDAPRVAAVFGSGQSAYAPQWQEAVRTSGTFAGTAEAAQADAQVVMDAYFDSETSFGLVVGAATLFLLPVPVEDNEYALSAKLRVPPLPDVDLPRVHRVAHVWGGIPLLLLSFINYDLRKTRESMLREVARDAAREYAALHERTWQAALASDSADPMEAFARAFPRSRNAARAQDLLEDRLWALVGARGDAASSFRYLRTYPDGEHAAECRAGRAEPVWREVASARRPEDLEGYLALFPRSPRAGEALALLDDVLWERAETRRSDAELYRAYAERFPSGAHVAEARDSLAWADAERRGTSAAVSGYLREHASGRHAADARRAAEVLADPLLAAVAASIPERVDRALRNSAGLPQGSGSYSGTMLSLEGEQMMSFAYDATFANGRVTSYDLKGGSVLLDGREYFLDEEGFWRPRFPRVFERAEPAGEGQP